MDTVEADLAWKMVSFEGIGNSEGATFKLGDLKVPGLMEDGMTYWFAQENSDYIATIASSGAQDKYYTWDPYEESWYVCDDVMEIDYDQPANDVELPMNQSIFIFSQYGAKFTLSGAVLQGDTAFYTVEADLTFTGNFNPAPFTLGDLVVPGLMEDGMTYWFAQENSDYIATIASSGAQDKYYTWDPYEESWYVCDDVMEIDYDQPANDVQIDPNVSFIIFTQYGVEINIPAAIK